MPGKSKKFELTGKEVSLAIVMAIMGFVFTTRPWILWLNTLTPFTGFVVYYIILYGAIYILSKLGLTVFGIKIEDKLESLGLLLITFAFFILVNWESAYIQYITNGSLAGQSVIYLQSEDGAVFWLWQQLLPSIGVEAWHYLTYVLTPFALALLGGLLISGKIRLD
jgi:hypothetical protein